MKTEKADKRIGLTKRVRVVLVRPQGGLNVGSVARIMKNFGVYDLAVVAPRADLLGEEARTMALSAIGILQRARICSSIAEATAGATYIVGATCRPRVLAAPVMPSRAAARRFARLTDRHRIAILFGREDKGLSNRDLETCRFLITIPSAGDFRSFNLAHAVGLVLYEVFLASGRAVPAPARSAGTVPATGEDLERMFAHIRRTLGAIGFFDRGIGQPAHYLRGLRRVFARRIMDQRDVRLVRAIFSHIDRVQKRHQGSANSQQGSSCI